MREYVGKICPYCKSIINEYDDVVLCSNCGMPHHKECWVENQGCTTFGCSGTIQTPEKTIPSVDTGNDFDIEFFSSTDDFVSSYCPKCGSVRSDGVFCSHCGFNFNERRESTPNVTTYQNSQYSGTEFYNTGGYNQSDSYLEEVMRYVNSNTEYYLPVFKRFRNNGSSASWNWGSFFIPVLWFSYRKMYGAAVGIYALLVFLELFNTVGNFFALVLYILLGIFGNKLYYNHIEKKMLSGNSLTEPFKSQYIVKNGGTSTAGVVLPIVGYIILIILLCSI